MSFKIMPYGGQKYRGHYADHCDIRQYLGLRPNQKLPIDLSMNLDLPLTDGRTVKALVFKGHKSSNGRQGKSSQHRVVCRCPDCDKVVPVGRTHQHKC